MTRKDGEMLGGLLIALVAHFALDGDRPAPTWTCISEGLLKQLADDGKKLDWPGGTAGVTVDPKTGDVFLVVPGQGLWKSRDRGESFVRVDGDTLGGRCETAYSLQFDPAGTRLACFLLDGKCGMSVDGGKTWSAFTDLGRNWD